MTYKPTRDLALFLTGIAGIFHETVISQSSDPQLLVLFASMIGLPTVLARDKKAKEKDGK